MNLSQEYLQSIKPKKRGVSDKYVWNIYRFFKENGLNDIHIFKTIDGNNIYFVYGNGNVGANMWTVLRTGSFGKIELFSFMLFNFKNKLAYEEITEEFFKNYKKLGRCYFDPLHRWWGNGNNRFTVINKNSMRCNWCGQWLHRKIEKVVTIKRKKIWELAK